MIKNRAITVTLGLLWVALLLAIGRDSSALVVVGSPVVGRTGLYDYSPSVIMNGSVQQFWWCGQGVNPNDPSQNTDTIQYESINISTQETYGPVTVLGETPTAWDSAYTCNPKVVRGTFVNPLGDNQNYTYAMYYVGTASSVGAVNSIGAAFSNDGIDWHKYPQPVIAATTATLYGVGQPAAYNNDGQAGIWIFYEDNNSPGDTHQVEARSIDGIHFTNAGSITTNGLAVTPSSWGDMAYDYMTGYWYAVFNVSTIRTGEKGQIGVVLYRIAGASLLTGSSPWEQLTTVNTNLTGYESNFIAGLLRDGFGNVNIGSYPQIEMYTSASNPRTAYNTTPTQSIASGDESYWDIAWAIWVPNDPLIPLNRFYNGDSHEVTTGWADLSTYHIESTLGYLYESPQQGASVALFGCKAGTTNYFISTDSQCEGQHILGLTGYAYTQTGEGRTPLYRCSTGADHFVSPDPACEGKITESLLGYAKVSRD